MDWKVFLKDKIWSFCLLVLGIMTIEIFLEIYPVDIFIRVYIPVVILGFYLIGLLIEYFRKRKFYGNVMSILYELDEKYLITELIKVPSFIEGKLLKEILNQTNQSMLEKVNQYKYLQEDYKEYIELWIHEIKIPIAVSKMVIENNKNAITKSIGEELQRIEAYIEQALFYARSNTLEKDYYI